MDFNDLYLFVGPPMTRGPPQLSLQPPLLPPPAAPAPLLPPMLPRPPMSHVKKAQKHSVRQQPYHCRKPSQRCLDTQTRPHVKRVESCEGNEYKMQQVMSELDLEYRSAKASWPNLTIPAVDSQAVYSAVLDMCPQFFALEPMIGDYF